MTTPCSRPVIVSYTRGSPLASSIIFTRSLPPVPPSANDACLLLEELKVLQTKTTSPSITHTGGPRLASQHSVTNSLSYNLTTKLRTALVMGVAVFVTVMFTSLYSASPHTCIAMRMSARCLAGTIITAATVLQMPLGGLHAS